MVVTSFESAYLANNSNQLISKWSSEVETEGGSSAAIVDDTNAIFLPPMKPETLKVCNGYCCIHASFGFN